MKIAHWKWLPLFVVLPLAACENPAPEEQPESPPAAEPAEVTAQQSVTVTNSMPHTMIVAVDENGEPRDLGPVASGETETFTVEGESDSEVDLVARDEGETHEVDFTVEIGAAPQSWTLGGG